MTLPAGPFSVAFSPDARTAYVACDVSEVLVVIDVATRTVQDVVPVGDAATGVATSPDGLTAYVATFSGVVPVDLATSIAGAPIGGGPFVDIAVTPNGQTAVATNFADDLVAFIDLGTATVTTIVAVGLGPFTLALSPDGAVAVTADAFGDTVTVIDMPTRTVVTTVFVGAFPEGVSFMPDGRSFYVLNSDDSTASLIDVATLTVVDTIGLGADAVRAWWRLHHAEHHRTGRRTIGHRERRGARHTPFRSFVPFHGGMLRLTGLRTTRSLSLLIGGGTIDTNGFAATVEGGVIGNRHAHEVRRRTRSGSANSHGGRCSAPAALTLLGPHAAPLSCGAACGWGVGDGDDVITRAGPRCLPGAGAGSVILHADRK